MTGSHLRAAPAVTVALTLVLSVSACTQGRAPRRSGSSSSTSAPVASAGSQPRSAPFRVVVTRVSGKLAKDDRSVLAGNVRRVLTGYVDAAFLGGTYPRSDFSDSFRTFTGGAAREARRDTGLLTNQRLGPSTESVRGVRRAAYLSVLAPYDVAAGVTAKLDLEFVVRRSTEPAQRVRLKGRMLLTRNADNGWSIFGYDLSRSDTAVPEAS